VALSRDRGAPSPLNPRYDYRRLNRSANTRLLWLREKVNSLTPGTSFSHDENIAYVVIESVNIWASFSRAYYLSWFMKPKTMTGRRVICVRHFASFQDALLFAIRHLRSPGYRRSSPSRRDEPTWHDSNNLLSLAAAVGVSNFVQISSALSFGATYGSNLPTVRNFYAHRNDETFRKVQTKAALLGLGTNLRPCEFVCASLPSRPQNLISDWLDEMRLTIELLCD
jgi:hypothetical protein